MKLLIVFGILATIALTNASLVPAATLIRAPHYDSAIIRSDRLGGNFAYSTLEGHAYKAYAPIVNTYHPLQYGYHPLQYGYSPFQATYPHSQQVFFGQPIFSPLSPVRPVELPSQFGSPILAQSPASQGTTVDEDTVAIEAA